MAAPVEPLNDAPPLDGRSGASVGATSILFVTGSLDIGGAERHLTMIAPQLYALGWRPAIYCLTGRGQQADDVEAAGVPVIGPPIAFSQSQSRVTKALALALSCLKLFGILLWQRPRIVHFFLPMAYVLGGPLTILAGIPRRVMSRRSLNLYQDKHPVLRRLEFWLHWRMTAILGNSAAVLAQLRSEGCDPVRTHLIYNGIAVSQAAVREPRAADALNLLIVANLIPYKGHADLLRALGGIAAQLPPAWTLRCAGRDDGIGPLLHDLAAKLGIEGHVEFLGEQRNVQPLLRDADLALLCSHEEGFSNAILEAMAAGLPVVATDVGGNREAVADGETGLIVPARNSAALGAAILALATDAALRVRMGEAGRGRVEQMFSLEGCVAQYDKLYRRIAEHGV